MTIDWWTLGLQTVNVAILIWLLARFFWRPVAAIIAERQAAAHKLLADAEAARAEAEAAKAQIDATRIGFAGERDAILAAAQATGEKVRAAALEEANTEAEQLRAAAEAEIARQNEEAKAVWTQRAGRLAVDIAQKLAARLDGTSVRDAFLDWLTRDIRALPEPVRLAALAEGVKLEVATPAPLTATDRKLYAQRIGEALGAKRPLTFSVDPDLIVGLELRGPNLLAESSWRADLKTILADLNNDRKA